MATRNLLLSEEATATGFGILFIGPGRLFAYWLSSMRSDRLTRCFSQGALPKNIGYAASPSDEEYTWHQCRRARFYSRPVTVGIWGDGSDCSRAASATIRA